MRVVEAVVDVPVSFGVVRAAVVRPVMDEGRRAPLLLCFADIFGNTEAHLRVMRRFASHGFIVVSPEPWAHHLPPGSVLDFEADRQRALDCQDTASADAADEARRALIRHFKGDDGCSGAVCAVGFCYGGHLSFRAATDEGDTDEGDTDEGDTDVDSRVLAAACFYGTGLHRDRLGSTEVKTLSLASHIKGELLLVWGRLDPHIPAEGRALIHRTLDDASVRFETRLYDAEHAFGRDVGPRYDAAAFDDAVAAALALFHRATR